MFKNETHNHPTEIEPFGGAATCIGGAIRDPLSGRAYVYQAMRVTGAATLGALWRDPARQAAAAEDRDDSGGGLFRLRQPDRPGHRPGHELYHPGYVAKRMEIGAVVGAAPEANVRREQPVPGDVVILLGGRTGRDGMRRRDRLLQGPQAESLETCGAEVQKGNAPEERKLQRLFRDPAMHRGSSSAATTSARAACPWPSASWPTAFPST